MERITYLELAKRFRAHESERPAGHLSANIVFTEDSFNAPFSLAGRTYSVSSNNKAYQPNMGGYSVFGSCVDGSDPLVRLDYYMAEEHGGKNGWKVAYCYMTPEISDGSEHIELDGYVGTWYVIESGNFTAPGSSYAKRCFLLESEQYGDETAHLIVSRVGTVLCDEAYNGFGDLVEAGWSRVSAEEQKTEE